MKLILKVHHMPWYRKNPARYHNQEENQKLQSKQTLKLLILLVFAQDQYGRVGYSFKQVLAPNKINRLDKPALHSYYESLNELLERDKSFQDTVTICKTQDTSDDFSFSKPLNLEIHSNHNLNEKITDWYLIVSSEEIEKLYQKSTAQTFDGLLMMLLCIKSHLVRPKYMKKRADLRIARVALATLADELSININTAETQVTNLVNMGLINRITGTNMNTNIYTCPPEPDDVMADIRYYEFHDYEKEHERERKKKLDDAERKGTETNTEPVTKKEAIPFRW